MNKIFGIGFLRTGTTSLTFALETLGIKTIHWPNDEKTYDQLIKGDYNLDVMKQYQSANDLTITPFFKQFDRVFPNSKFILTVRDIDCWLESVENHWKNDINKNFTNSMSLFEKVTLFCRAANFGCLNYSKERFVEIYEEHFEKVTKHFKNRPNDLLIMDICKGEGWEKLCPFLNKPTPNVCFPYKNKGNYKKIIKFL